MSYYYKSEGNHDSSKQLVGYGVVFIGVPDGLIVAVETPLEGVVFRGKNEKWKSNCEKGKTRQMKNNCPSLVASHTSAPRKPDTGNCRTW